MANKQSKKNTAKPSPPAYAAIEHTKGAKGSFSITAKLAFILAVVSIMVYANTFNNGYVLDDFSVITKNTIVTKGVSAIPEILSTPYRWGFYKIGNQLYRPLSLVMFATEYQVWGENPVPGHIINVLLFAACVVLLFIFLDNLFEKKKTAAVFIASLLFALHPVHTEVVANIKSRDELLCFFFAFLSLITFIGYAESSKIKHLVFGVFSFFLALLSKESAITFLAVFPLVFFFYRNENKKRSIYITISSAIAVFIFLFIRFYVLNTYHANNISEMTFMDNILSRASSVASRFATAILVMGKYIKLLFIPYPLLCDYSYGDISFVSFGNAWVLLSLAEYLSFIIVGIYRLVKFPKDPFAFGILFFLITISLFSNIFFLLGAIMGERFIFFASAVFCLLASLIIEKLAGPFIIKGVTIGSKKAALIIIPLCLVYTIITIGRNSDWKDGLTLYKADVKNAPNNAKLYFYLGSEQLITASESGEKGPDTKQHLLSEAINNLQKSITIYPDYADAHKTIGNAFFFASQIDSAELHLKKAWVLNPKDIEPLNHLDMIYFNTQKYLQSIELCQKAISIDPLYKDGYSHMGMCYIRLAKYDSAIYILNKGLTIDNDFNPFYENLAWVYEITNATDSAKKYQEIARKNNPSFGVY